MQSIASFSKHLRLNKRRHSDGFFVAAAPSLQSRACCGRYVSCNWALQISKELSRKARLRKKLAVIYFLLTTGFLAPLVNYFLTIGSYNWLLNIIFPGLSALLVTQLQKSAAQLLKEGGSFAIPEVYELRRKYLARVNRLEKVWLVLAGYALIWSAL